jgi:hypothetical protein
MSKTDQRGKAMKRLAALLAIAVAFGAMFLTSAAGAREPTGIEKCQTISHPGSYKLVNDLTITGPPEGASCLVITADFVTIDLAGFSITNGGEAAVDGIAASPPSGELRGIAVRNGSISGAFGVGVDLGSAIGSIVEGLRVFLSGGGFGTAIIANGIVKGNIAFGADLFVGPAMEATGIVTGNYVAGGRSDGLVIGQGSTVIGNTATGASRSGIDVSCPSNVSNNTAVGNGTVSHSPNLVLTGDGCRSEDNVAP